MTRLFDGDVEFFQYPEDYLRGGVTLRARLTFGAEMNISKGALTRSHLGQRELLKRARDQLSEAIHRKVFDEAIGELAALRQDLFCVDPEDNQTILSMVDRVSELILLLQRGRGPR